MGLPAMYKIVLRSGTESPMDAIGSQCGKERLHGACCAKCRETSRDQSPNGFLEGDCRWRGEPGGAGADDPGDRLLQS